MRANGTFLALVGGTQVIFELLSHFFGVGPWARIFAASHYTIGFLEAHGLAFLIGTPLVGFGPLLANVLGLIGAMMMGVGYIWLGYALWKNPTANEVYPAAQ
jgi:hypothetical protein